MKRTASRLFLLVLLLLPAILLHAEKVADLPLPTSYVNDFADVLSPATKQSLEDLCVQLHQKANADVSVVTIKTLDDDQTVEDFTGQLEEKWKLGKKGQDRSAIYVIVINSHKMRIEVGYGLEGILPDAKVGRILDDSIPAAKEGDWDQAVSTGTRELAQDIATDAQVTLTPTVHHYHRQGAAQGYGDGQQHLGIGQIILGVIFLAVLLILVLTGHIGWAWMLLWSVMGGGGGGGRDDDDRGGGGFGGMGGGSSGGGGASRDF